MALGFVVFCFYAVLPKYKCRKKYSSKVKDKEEEKQMYKDDRISKGQLTDSKNWS